jgi:hypothetical protein
MGQAARGRLGAPPLCRPGEPALGPTAYPHRLSASENPTAPLSHHNQDSTHISDDVVTVGVSSPLVALEGSAFHGREPDENRWNIDQGRIDSYSSRLTVRPVAGLSFQISAGRLQHPEAIEPGHQTRETASLAYEGSVDRGFIALTLAAGRNQTPEGPEWGNLFEWTWKVSSGNFVYGRLESVDRDLYELIHKRQRPDGMPRQRTLVQAATLGFVRDLPLLVGAETGLGADLTLYRFTSRLDAVYGARPASIHAFLRIRFGSGESMSHMPGMSALPAPHSAGADPS